MLYFLVEQMVIIEASKFTEIAAAPQHLQMIRHCADYLYLKINIIFKLELEC